MAFFGSNLPGEVGLRVLLAPLGSNVVFRTACCSVGVVLPVYSTFKAIETKNHNEQQRWLVYWAAYGSFTIAEAFTDKLISWFPLYYHMKLAFLVWLQLPTVDAHAHHFRGRPFESVNIDGLYLLFQHLVSGANQLYVNHLRPFLMRHQARLDQIVGFLYTEMAKFLSAHQAEMKFAKTMVTKLYSSAKQAFSDPSHPVPRRANRTIEGPTHVRPQPGTMTEGPTSQVEEDQVSDGEND